jgi:cytochrome c biogenesis protein CcdA
MKNDIKQNIMINNDEEIYKEFPKLKGRDYFCQIVLTTKRLVIYTQGNTITKNRKTKKRGMNEIELKSINHLEYYLEYTKNSFFIRLLGFVLLLGSLILAYGIYQSLLTVPVYPYSYIINYAILGLVLIIGLFLLFRVKKVLYFKVISGFNIITELELQPTKYNELALKYLASKFY